jgi:hypothetical protein
MRGVTTMNRKELIKYISAFAMGDAWVGKGAHQKTCRMQISHVTDNQDYLDYKADILSNLTRVHMSTVDKDGNRRLQGVLRTMAHPIYNQIRDRLYFGNYKSVDPHYLKLLDWEMLAILFMDDGNISNKERKMPCYKLNLCRLSYGDYDLLRRALKERLGLIFNIYKHKDKYVLGLLGKQATMFEDNVSKYILPSFRYKLRDERQAPEMGGDIVCSVQECIETSRNDLVPTISGVTI